MRQRGVDVYLHFTDTYPYPQTLHNIGTIYADNSANNDQGDDAKAFEYFRRGIATHKQNKSERSHSVNQENYINVIKDTNKHLVYSFDLSVFKKLT